MAEAPADVVALHIGPGGGQGAGLTLNTWKSYHFNSNFTSATDGWSFTLGDEDLSDDIRLAIAPRQKVTLSVNGRTQGAGIVDRVIVNASRSGGTEVTIEGRDAFSPLVDSVVDPRVQFNQGMNLRQFLEAVFLPYGWNSNQIFDFSDQDALDRGVLTGKAHGVHTTKKGKPIKQYQLHELKPKAHETAFAFAQRVTQRFGLWLWPSVDGNFVICGQPDFDQKPEFFAIHKRGRPGAVNNIVKSSLQRDFGHSQPSVIICSGFSSGGELSVDQFTVGIANPMVQTDLTPIWKAYPKVKPIDLSYLGKDFSGNGKDTSIYNATGLAVTDTNARPLFLTDPDSKDISQLEAFAKRELALRIHRSFLYKFEVEGHSQPVAGEWNVNCMVGVDDDVSDVHGSFWILDRTFIKDRHGGTRTTVECILPGSLQF